MKRTGLILLGLILLVLPLAACATDESDVDIQQNSRIGVVETWKTAVEAATGGVGLAQYLQNLATQIGQKVSQSDFSSLQSQVNTMSGANSYPKSETYTKIEVNTMINALKSDQSWITGGTHTTPAGTTEGEYGVLVASDGKLELWVDKVSPASDFYTAYGANDDVCYFGRVTVVNTDLDNRHSFDLSLFIIPDSACTLKSDNVTAYTRLTTSGDDFSGFVTAKDISSPLGYTVKEDYEFEFHSKGHGSIKADYYRKYVISLDICQMAPIDYEVYWEWNWEIFDRD